MLFCSRGLKSDTMPTHNKHTHYKYTHNKHFPHNKHTLFALTKICLFREEQNFGKINSLFFSTLSRLGLINYTQDAKSSTSQNKHNSPE